MLIRSIALVIGLTMVMATAGAQERADSFPTRSVKIVVPFPAGGPSDVLARMIGQKMTEDWGQPVLVENRPGANTVLGAQQVAKGGARRLHAADGDRFHAHHESVPLSHAAL
jgi:tripartite-type tricarboxylate transporter receptor subunit TctC